MKDFDPSGEKLAIGVSPQAGVSELLGAEQVYDTLQRKAAYLQIINELALALLQQNGMDNVLWLVARSTIAKLGFQDCVIYLLDDSGQSLTQKAAHGPKNPVAMEILDPIAIPLGKGIVGSVAASGKAEIVVDASKDSRYIQDDTARLSEIAVPIIHEGRVIGVIDSEHPEAGFYTEEHKEILTTIASMSSTKIASALTIERLNETIDQLRETRSALHLGEQRYRELYDHHPSMFFTVNGDSVITSANYFASEQLGYPLSELVDLPITDLLGSAERVHFEEQLNKCLTQPGRLHRWESSLITQDGKTTWIRSTARVMSFEGESTPSILLVAEDITDTHHLSKELMYQASHDALTDLFNRREFERRLDDALESARVENVTHALMYLDLDQFKVINDTCGHVAGDELLRQLALAFREHTRRSDTLARLGGDEFGVLMEFCTLEQALRLAEDLRKDVENFRFQWGSKVFSVGVSIGLVPITASSDTILGILGAADSACYTAKEAGRNRLHVYREDDEALVKRNDEMHWVARVNAALEEDRFLLYYQPIAAVSEAADAGAHYEFLLRMRDENGDVVSPESFLPAAERYGLAVAVDRWVVSHVLLWLSQDKERLDELSMCSINLSGLSLGDQEFLHFIIEQIRHHQIPPEKLCLEITETAAIANLSRAREFIGALKELGCRFALDDFGSGLSSFAYLKTLPVDFLKIDGFFVRDIVTDPIDRAMVNSINDIGHMMGIATIAEFVEDEEILKLIVSSGVDYAQGMHIGSPRPVSEYPIAVSGA